MIWSCSSIEYAQLSTFESTIKKMNQTFQLVKNMDGQESNSFVENICKIAQFDSVEEKIVLLPSNQSNSLEEPMTSVKAAHIISSEIEVANSVKEQQLKRQQRNKTLPKKLQQKLPLITKPSLSRNLRSSTTKKKEEKEEVLIKTEELEGINQNIEVEEVTPPPPSAVIVGSKKRKRTEIDLLKPPLQPDNVEQQPEDVGGPPAKNLRRSSYSSKFFTVSPFSHSSESKSSLVTKKEVQKESISSVSDVVKSQPILSPIEQEAPILPIKPIPSPLQLSIQPLHSHVAATAKLRSSLRRAALASSTPSPAVDSVGTNGLFLRPGNHSSTEIIPKQVLLTLLRDISSHRHCYIFEKPVEEEEVPGYHSAIKKPMDLQTLHQLIESCAIQTFGQFTHHILLIYANAVMYNSTGHHVNTCAKEMLDFAFKCIEVVQYPSGQWPPPLHIPATPALATSVSRQSIASESDGPNDGQLSRSSSGISCSQIPSTSNTTTKTLASTQQKILRSSSTSKGNKIKSINSSASSSASSYSSETKKEV
ncbi:Bromo domain-containing protein [Meloidogyne graminicola]|uniref:Bromo domain-containing protein n=1 Tax=Meloidogyne graminicola TaxID=189291 RepID=A0A8S9ZT37_9BILA|nr:Bromo domain-containing protein [Meloidogyne graminicola]